MSARPRSVADGLRLDEREVKFLPTAAAAHFFWAVASLHLRPQVGVAARAYSRTTYYDTADHAFGRADGHRLRVREYSQPIRDDEAPVAGGSCFLERKLSADGRRAKTRLALRPDQVAAELLTLAAAPLLPRVATWYRRQALVDSAGSLRVTLDDRILLCRPRPLGSPFAPPGCDEVLAHGPEFVLEYKSWVAPPPWLVRALDGLDEAVGFSKFVLGVRALGDAAYDDDDDDARGDAGDASYGEGGRHDVRRDDNSQWIVA